MFQWLPKPVFGRKRAGKMTLREWQEKMSRERVLGTEYKIPSTRFLPVELAGGIRIRYEGGIQHPQLEDRVLTLPIPDGGFSDTEFCILKTEERRTLLLRVRCYGSDGRITPPIAECWYGGTDSAGLPFLRKVQSDAYAVLIIWGEDKLFDPSSQCLTEATDCQV